MFIERFQRRWQVQRRASNGFVFQGEALVEPTPTGWRYAEQVLGIAPAPQLTATKAYDLRPSDGGLIITHADAHNAGEPFQTLRFDLVGGRFLASAENLCGEDFYRSRYIIGRNRMEIEHVVNGPKKDYSLRTVLSHSVEK